MLPSSNLLPHSLLDLAFSRLAYQHTYPVLGSRWMATQAARQLQLRDPPSPVNMMAPTFTRRPVARGIEKRSKIGALQVRTAIDLSDELDTRVQALEEAVKKEEAAVDPPIYSEEEISFFYQDILTLPESTAEVSQTQQIEYQGEEDHHVVEAARQRLDTQSLKVPQSIEVADSSLSETLAQQISSDAAESLQLDQILEPGRPPPQMPAYVHLIWRARQTARRLHHIRWGTEDEPVPVNLKAPVSILTIREWEAMIRVALKAHDGEGAEYCLQLMSVLAVPAPEEFLGQILKFYSQNADITRFERCLTQYGKGTPTGEQRRLHIMTYLKATPPKTIPTSTLALLHKYEEQACPVPIEGYTAVISNLSCVPSAVANAQAWDIFTHMRYVAHPNPDAHLYSIMIRACASPISLAYPSEPERALDLWHEMVVDHQIAPTLGTYNAAILACARSGDKIYVNEAFRLAKEMLDSHRDAFGQNLYRPDRKTFCALLEGAKRVGDLGRARWILAEIVGDGPANTGIGLDEEVMMHLFHAYASYKPPFTRSITKVVQEKDMDGPATMDSDTTIDREVQMPDLEPSFKHIPPQSHPEVLAEAEILFKRITAESDDKFSDVELTTRLLNSYLSVQYAHGSITAASELFWRIFEEHGVQRSPRSYLEALVVCASAKKHDRPVALKFADELFEDWKVVEDAAQSTGKPVDSRLVERVHNSYIRMLSLTDNLDRAMSHLRHFVSRYPPTSLRRPTPKPVFRSSRTVLLAPRPLVRMSSQTSVPDDHVPPLLTFGDVEILHHRLVASGRIRDVNYIKYICKSYQWALRVRRDEAMKAKPEQI